MLPNTPSYWLCALCLLSSSTLARAQSTVSTPTNAAGVARDDDSRITSQVASFAVTRLKDSPAVVTVVTGEDIRNAGARDLIDVLYMVPGYFIGLDTQGVVGPGFRGLWGHEGKILLIIDGKEMNELLYSNMQLGNEFPVELIERVEVVRGPGSVIYGGSAELSVINVVTRGLQGATDLKLTANYGQMTGAPEFSRGYGRRSLSASGRYVFESVPGLSSFMSASIGQGQRSVRDFEDYAGNRETMAGRSALDPAVIQAGVGYRDVQATFLYQHLRTTYISGFGTITPGAPPEPTFFDSYHGEVLATLRPTNRLEVVPRFNVTYQQPWHSPNQGDFFVDKAVRRLRGRLLGRWAPIDELQVTAGGDAMFDDANLLTPATEPVTGLQTAYGGSSHVGYQTIGGYLELFSDNPVLNVAAGARYDHHSRVGGALVPRLVLLRSFGPVSLKALLSYSFRGPGVENIALGVNVRPERSRILELEGSLDLSAGQRLSANVFDVAIDAPIAFVPTEAGEGYQNLGRQGTRGVEVSYRLRGALGRLEANYSFYAPSITENLPPYTVPGHSSQFLGASAHKVALTATVRPWPWLNISPTAVILGERFTRGPTVDDTETAVAIPAQVLANLFVHADNVGVDGLSLGLGVYNMFGADYRFVRPAANSEPNVNAPLPGLDREIMLRLSYYWESHGE